MHQLRADHRLISGVPVILVLAGLTACGGGGGGGGGGSNPPPQSGLTLSLSTNTITFNSVPPSAPAPVDVTATLTGTGSGTLFILVGTSNPAVANITNVFVTGPTTGQGTIVPGSPAGLGAGSFTATIQVRACLNDSTCASGEVRGSPQTINITYNITGVRSSAANLTYNIGNTPTAADVTRSFNVTGFPAQSWSVTTNAPWLTLNPPSGNSSASVAVSANLAPTPLDALNSGIFTGNIVLTPTTGLPVTIPVTLNVARTQVNYVSPYVGQSGVGGDVIIRGDNFSLITPTGVRFGTNDATVFSVVSNTEIRATHGPLAAGSYDVRIVNNDNIDRTRARLQVVDVPIFAQAALPYPDGPGDIILYNLIYDAERRAVFVTMRYGADPPGPSSGRLLRWGYNGASWDPATQKQFLANNAIRLTADGTQLLVAHHDPLFQKFAVAELDPVTLVENRMTRFTQDYEANSMAISSTGEAIIIGDLSCCSGSFPVFGYSPLTGVLRTVTQPGVFSVMDAFAAGSADGSMVLVPNNNDPILNPGQPTLRYDSNIGALIQNPVSARAFIAPQINRHATRLLFDRLDVRDANLALLGSLPNSTQNAVLDPVELRAYAYENNTVRVYDLDGTLVNGIYPEISPAIPVSNDPGGANFITISPDGGTLFIAGTDQVVVVPLP